jgi:hypothetical protein
MHIYRFSIRTRDVNHLLWRANQANAPVTGRTRRRGLDWRCGKDQAEASPQAEDRPPGCQLLLKLLLENNFPRVWAWAAHE